MYKYETLRAIGETYEHWKELIAKRDFPTIKNCPLCRLTFELFRVYASCSRCPVQIVTGKSCPDHFEFTLYDDTATENEPDEALLQTAGVAVLDKILTLWLAVQATWGEE